jgi:hypothetical protein
VLWHTEVEEETPAEIAPLLGMRPNGVAALAYRAREGLRQAYLRAHLPDVESRECQATVAKLAGWVRRSVPVPLGRKISKHLAVCADCRARVDTLTRVNQELRASVAPILLGASFAAAYAPVTAASGAAGAMAVKTLVAKVAVVAVIAATAVTTMASAPNSGGDSQGTAVPALAEPTEATDSIEGPADTGSSDAPSVGVTSTTTVPVPVDPEAASEDSATETTTATDTTATDAKAEKEAAKAEKEAAKAEKKAEKEAAKESKKAEKGK